MLHQSAHLLLGGVQWADEVLGHGVEYAVAQLLGHESVLQPYWVGHVAEQQQRRGLGLIENPDHLDLDQHALLALFAARLGVKVVQIRHDVHFVVQLLRRVGLH